MKPVGLYTAIWAAVVVGVLLAAGGARPRHRRRRNSALHFPLILPTCPARPSPSLTKIRPRYSSVGSTAAGRFTVHESENVFGSRRRRAYFWCPRGQRGRSGRTRNVWLDDRHDASPGANDHRQAARSVQRQEPDLQVLRRRRDGDVPVQARLQCVRRVPEPEDLHWPDQLVTTRSGLGRSIRRTT